MAEQPRECPNCAKLLHHLEVLERRLAQTMGKLREAEARIEKLQEQLAGAKKDSSNSSKPPSSDITKPPKKPALRQRRLGGQKGHAPQQRPRF
jgi:hypothetical protein